MNYRRIVFVFILGIVIVISSFAQTMAKSVLIKLSLKESNDWTNAVFWGVVVYQRFDDFVIAEFEKTRLAEWDGVGLTYQIIDENPWSEDYFLVSYREGVAKVNLEPYGRIILENPRWQLIKGSKDKISELRRFGYSVVPIHHNPIPLTYKAPSTLIQPVSEYSPVIDTLLNLVSQDSLYVWDLRLQNFKTRYSYIDSIYRARDWLYNKFVNFGIDSLWFHHYYYDSDQWNVVATVPGTANPDRVIVVGGHYDSVVYGAGTDPLNWAPGADDNGSGTVATLEMARIIAKHPLPVTVMFVPFAQEEQGLIGSNYFAGYLHNQGTDVKLMINSDMIGHSVDNDTDVTIYGALSAKSYIDLMMEMANTYTYLHPHYDGQISGSDHYSFSQWGYDAVFAEEGDFHYAGWHTNYDVVDSLNFNYIKEVVKMNLATLIQVSYSPSPVENLHALNGTDGHTVYLSWSTNPPGDNVVHYNVY